MFDAAKTLKRVSQYTSTYKAGLLEAKAYRVFKKHTSLLLKPHSITALDWSLLGILFDEVSGVRLNTLADELGVEAPLVTRMTTTLRKKQLLEFKVDSKDSRARIVNLTKKGRDLVTKLEKKLRTDMKPLFRGISVPNLATYVSVLLRIVENSPEDNDRGTYY